MIIHRFSRKKREIRPNAKFYAKNTIRDGGSTALYSAYTIYNVFTVYIIQTLQFCIATTVACMPIVLFRKIRTLLECAHAMSMPMKWASEQKVGLDWIEWCGVDTP